MSSSASPSPHPNDGEQSVAVGANGNEESELHQSCLRMADIGRDLAARARDAGAIAPGVTGADVTALVSAVAWTSERTSAQQAGRLLDLVLATTLSGDPAAGLCEDDSARLLEHPDYRM